MKTKFITLSCGILLATFSNIIEAEPKDGEAVQPSEAARFIAEVLQAPLRSNPVDATQPLRYEVNVLMTEQQLLTLKHLCIYLGPQFGCDSIHPHTPISEDITALCNAYNPDSHYDFFLREPAPIRQDAFFREVLQSLSEKVRKQAETIKKLEAEKNLAVENAAKLSQEKTLLVAREAELGAQISRSESEKEQISKQNTQLQQDLDSTRKIVDQTKAEIAAIKAKTVIREEVIAKASRYENAGLVERFKKYL